MNRSLRGLPAAVVVAGALGASLAPAAAQGPGVQPRVTAAVQVTANPDPARAHSTPVIAVNPRTRELVIAEAEVRSDKRCRIHLSVDDGRSWFPGGDPMIAPMTDCTLQATNGQYITLQFDAEGILWASWFANDPKVAAARNRDEVPRSIFLGRSPDSGRTWQTTKVFEGRDGDPGVGGSRRPLIAVDPRNSQFIVVGWQKGRPSDRSRPRSAQIAVSRDGGRTFGQPRELSDERGGNNAHPTIDGKGVIHVVFSADGNVPTGSNLSTVRPLLYTRSSDRGATWTPLREIDPGNPGFAFMRKELILADPNSDNVYVTWYGNTKVDAKRPPAGKPSTAEFDDREIYVRVSHDGGDTWSGPVVVNDDASRPNIQHYDSGFSIAPNGRLDIAWYDFRNSPTPEFESVEGGNAGGANDVYYAYSTDGGRTFSPNLRVTDRVIDRTIGVWSNAVHSHSNVGIASTDDSVYVTWQDTRNGGDAGTSAEDVYFAALKFPVAEEGDDGEGAPAWAVAGAAGTVGMGLTIMIALGLARARRAG